MALPAVARTAQGVVADFGGVVGTDGGGNPIVGQGDFQMGFLRVELRLLPDLPVGGVDGAPGLHGADIGGVVIRLRKRQQAQAADTHRLPGHGQAQGIRAGGQVQPLILAQGGRHGLPVLFKAAVRRLSAGVFPPPREFHRRFLDNGAVLQDFQGALRRDRLALRGLVFDLQLVAAGGRHLEGEVRRRFFLQLPALFLAVYIHRRRSWFRRRSRTDGRQTDKEGEKQRAEAAQARF